MFSGTIEDDMFPIGLIGPAVQVRRWWRPRARQLLQGAAWADIVEGEKWISISNMTGQFHLDKKGYAKPHDAPSYIVPQEIDEQSFEVMSDREEMYQQVKRILLTGLDHLWVAISFLPGVGFPYGTSYDHEKAQLYAHIVEKQIRHWDWYCANERRINTPLDLGFVGTLETPLMRWHTWAGDLFAMTRQLGMTNEEATSLLGASPQEIGKSIRRVLNDYRNRAIA